MNSRNDEVSLYLQWLEAQFMLASGECFHHPIIPQHCQLPVGLLKARPDITIYLNANIYLSNRLEDAEQE